MARRTVTAQLLKEAFSSFLSLDRRRRSQPRPSLLRALDPSITHLQSCTWRVSPGTAGRLTRCPNSKSEPDPFNRSSASVGDGEPHNTMITPHHGSRYTLTYSSKSKSMIHINLTVLCGSAAAILLSDLPFRPIYQQATAVCDVNARHKRVELTQRADKLNETYTNLTQLSFPRALDCKMVFGEDHFAVFALRFGIGTAVRLARVERGADDMNPV